MRLITDGKRFMDIIIFYHIRRWNFRKRSSNVIALTDDLSRYTNYTSCDKKKKNDENTLSFFSVYSKDWKILWVSYFKTYFFEIDDRYTQNLNLDIVFYSFNLFFFFSKPRTRENICIIVFCNSTPGSKNPKIEAFALSLEDETLLKIITITDLPSPATKKNNGDIPRFQRIFTYSYFFILEKMKVSLIPLCG